MTQIAYISLGANQGDAQIKLAQALDCLASLADSSLLAQSSLYLTEPQDYRQQPWFHNQVAALEVGESWTAEKLLQSLLQIEQKLGRLRSQDLPRFGPRAIDLDLLLFGQEIRQTQNPTELSLPHPRLEQRAFVLIPLQEIAPDIMLPLPERGIYPLAKILAKLDYQLDGNIIRQA